MSWGDYNNDGTPDLLYAGTRSGFPEDNITRIYKNTGTSGFAEIYHTLPRLMDCEVEWVDVNNDGLSDIYYQGINSDNAFVLGIHKNKGNDSFEPVQINISGISGPKGNLTVNSAEWADFNNDGLKDVVIAMSSADDFRFEFYQNLGNFEFQKTDIGLPRLNYVQMATGDINQDGLIDLVFMGSTKSILTSQDMTAHVYTMVNNGDFTFNSNFRISNVGVFMNSLQLADLDNDGYSDLLIYGTGSNMRKLMIQRNNHNNTFSPVTNNLSNSDFGGAVVGDIDNDHDLDILYYGRIYSPVESEVTYIYENLSANANESPQPPDTISAFAVNNDIEFSWTTGSDDLNIPEGLYYNLLVGSDSQPDSRMAGMSFDGKLKTVSPGNIKSGLNFRLTDFPEGQFKAKLQSVDHAYNASAYSDTLDFCFKHTSNIFGDTLSVCSGDSVTIGTEGNYSGYLWNTGSQNPFITVGTEGNYNLNLFHNDGCISSETVYVKVNPRPVFSLGRDTTITTFDTLLLVSNQQFSSYLWSDDSQNDSLVFLAAGYGVGIHGIWLEAGYESGCYSADTILVTVVEGPGGIVDLKGANGFIYPLPFRNEIILENKSAFIGQVEITIINGSGKLVFAESFHGIDQKHVISMPDLPEGIYFLTVYYKSQQLKRSYKIIK
jgi:hypothetical protein